MNDKILRPNVAPLYHFLSFIEHKLKPEEKQPKSKILDCGAGGPLPPLTLFYQHGFECYGIDLIEEHLAEAKDYCAEHDLKINLKQGDMRNIPYEDGYFDYIYEEQSMCHLTKADTAVAIGEMYRVLKPGGYCHLGVISDDSNPMFGEQKDPGEFWSDFEGHDWVHSVFDDREADALVAKWTIIRKDKNILNDYKRWRDTSLETWMEWYKEMSSRYTKEQWQAMYDRRLDEARYIHIRYLLKK